MNAQNQPAPMPTRLVLTTYYSEYDKRLDLPNPEVPDALFDKMQAHAFTRLAWTYSTPFFDGYRNASMKLSFDVPTRDEEPFRTAAAQRLPLTRETPEETSVRVSDTVDDDTDVRLNSVKCAETWTFETTISFAGAGPDDVYGFLSMATARWRDDQNVSVYASAYMLKRPEMADFMYCYDPETEDLSDEVGPGWEPGQGFNLDDWQTEPDLLRNFFLCYLSPRQASEFAAYMKNEGERLGEYEAVETSAEVARDVADCAQAAK